MTAEQKIVQYLEEAHALEAALVQTLTAHIAMTPSSEYRSLLERHLEETRGQAERILGRLSGLGETRNPLQLAYGIAQTAIGQLVAAGKFPLDLIRGTGGEEKLLKNARDEAASEALEIATYDSIEALAEAAGDEETATLAREHREQEEAFLAQLRETIPQLARDVLAAEAGGEPTFDVAQTGAVQAARAVAGEVRGAAQRAAGSGSGSEGGGQAPDDGGGDEDAGDDTADLPIAGYEDLTVEQVLPKLRLLTRGDLAKVEAFEREHRERKRVLDRIEKLRSSANGRRPARAR